MNKDLQRPAQSRGVVVVASDSAQFMSVVSEMVAGGGFTPMQVPASELRWESVREMRPCLVICDCEAPTESVQRIFAEASTGRIPLLLSQSGPKPDLARALRSANRVAWFTFPISREAFGATLETVLLTVPSAYRIVASAAGAKLDAGISVRDLTVASRGEM